MGALAPSRADEIRRHDDAAKWAALIRAHLEADSGRSERDRRMADSTWIDPATGVKERYYSLRG